MKQTFQTITAVLVLILAAPFLYAASISKGPVNVKATVPSGITLQMRIVDQLTGAEVPSMDFGDLGQVNEEYRAAHFFKVYLTVNAGSTSFDLTQNATDLLRSGGAEVIPSGAYMMKPEYIESDNDNLPKPPSAAPGQRTTAVGNHLLFRDPTGLTRVVTTTYTLSGDPATGATSIITLGQKSGSYNGTVQYTLTTS